MGSATSFAATLTKDNISYPQDDTTTSDVKEGISYLNVGMENATDTWQGNLVVGDLADVQGDVDNVGAFNDSWAFVTPDGGKTNEKITSGLKITGTLTLQGNGKIVLGGQYKGASSYLGLEATESITVTGGSLTSTKIITNSLNVSGGAVSTNTGNCTSGNGYAGGPKQSYIKNSLTISGGSLSFGYTANVQGIGGAGHRMTAFGSSASFVMTQTGGTMRVYGDMDMRSGITIDQSAGTMVLRDTIYMGFSGTTTIKQRGDAKLVLGRLESTVKSYTPHFDIEQSGAGLIHLAYGSNFAKESTIKLTQTGTGTINIGGLHDTSITGTLPSRGYELNNSPFEAINTTYSINQTSGTINLKGVADIQADIATIGSELNVAETAVLKAAQLNLSDKSSITTIGKLVAGTTADGAVAGDVLNVTTGGTLNLDNGYGSATHAGAIKDVQMSGGEINYKGAVVLDSVDVKGGTLNLTDSGANLTIGSLAVAAAVSKGVCLTADTVGTETSAPLTIADSGSWTMGADSTFALSFTDNYLGTIDSLADATTEAVDFKFKELVATGTVDTDALATKFELSGMSSQWTLGSAKWTQDSGKTYVSGVLVYDAWIDVDDGGTFADSVDDETTELKTGLSISEKDVTLNGDNKHTLGTKIDGGDTGITVTLGHANALGAGEVSTTGKTTLTTTSEVTTDLNVVISNSGALTLDGSYDVGTLADSSGVVIPAGYVAADGDVTADGNGFRRVDGYTVQVVDNDAANGATLTGGDNLKLKDGTLEGVLDEATGEVTFGAGVDYSTYRMVEAVEESAQAIIDASVGTSGPQVEKVTMTAGTLKVDASITVDAEDGTTLKMTGNDVKLTGEIDGASTSVQVTGSGIIEGDNSYSGGTVIDGGKLTVASDKALGTGDVVLKNHGTLDLSGKAVSNYINVEGCTLAGAGAYSGIMDVSGNLQLQDATTAAKVVMLGGGTISGAPLTTTALDVQTDGNATVGGDLTINDNGTITLNNGSLLEVGGSLTLGNGTKLVLNGDYAVGTSLLSSTGTLTMGDVSLVYGDSTVELEKQGNSLVLVSKFKQNKATATTLTNWGIATASRAFVNAVRGQRSNTGCIADGKGTAWVASLGSKHEINGSDINISGAAVGADTQVGRDSRIGIALGYVEGEVQPSGLRQVDQEGSYIAAYGEHGLKKLSSTSCLSMDWVAAYGVTDSEGAGQKWEQDSVQLNSRVNWNKKVNDKLCMSVFGGLEYFANNSDTVDGVKTGSIQNLRGEIGVGARYVAWGAPAATASYDEKGAMLTEARPGCEKLVLNGEIRYMNDMVRSNPVIRMEGLSGMGENPGRQGIGIEAGATYRIGERWSASANYGFNTMEDSKEHRVNVGAAYTF